MWLIGLTSQNSRLIARTLPLITVTFVVLCPFPICYGSKKIEDYNKYSECCKVMPHIHKGRSLQIYSTHNLDIVARRQNDCKLLRPLGH